MGTSERQLVRALFPWLCRLLSMVVYGGGNFGCRVACLPAPLLDRLLVERMSGDLADSTHQLVHTTALLLLRGLHSALQRPSELPLLTFNLDCPLLLAVSTVSCFSAALSAARVQRHCVLHLRHVSRLMPLFFCVRDCGTGLGWLTLNTESSSCSVGTPSAAVTASVRLLRCAFKTG